MAEISSPPSFSSGQTVKQTQSECRCFMVRIFFSTLILKGDVVDVRTEKWKNQVAAVTFEVTMRCK